jgi:hypothetical protein
VHGDTNQIWRVTYYSSGEYYTIVPVADTSKRLYQSGTKASVGGDTSIQSQWKITYVSNGYYTITNRNTTHGLRAPAEGASTNYLTVEPYPNQDVFLWEFVEKFQSGQDFISSSDGLQLQKECTVVNDTLAWQKTKIQEAADKWNEAGGFHGLNIELVDSGGIIIDATASPPVDEPGFLGEYLIAERKIKLYYVNIESYAQRHSPGETEAVIQNRIQSVYQLTALHELGHHLGLADNPPGTSPTGIRPEKHTPLCVILKLMAIFAGNIIGQISNLKWRISLGC